MSGKTTFGRKHTVCKTKTSDFVSIYTVVHNPSMHLPATSAFLLSSLTQLVARLGDDGNPADTIMHDIVRVETTVGSAIPLYGVAPEDVGRPFSEEENVDERSCFCCSIFWAHFLYSQKSGTGASSIWIASSPQTGCLYANVGNRRHKRSKPQAHPPG